MAFVITPPCIDLDHDVCGRACMDVCPVKCIYPPEQTRLPAHRQRDLLYVHPYECVHCGACVPACPVGAIFAEDEVPSGWSEYIEVHIAAFESGCGEGKPCPYGLACPYPRWKRAPQKQGDAAAEAP